MILLSIYRSPESFSEYSRSEVDVEQGNDLPTREGKVIS